MSRQTGLRTSSIDFHFKGGLSEKISPEMSPPEGAYVLENAELDKIGVYRRRRGMKPMSQSVLPPSAPASFGTPKKVAGRASELFAIAEDAGSFGSGGGAGSAGAMVWSYSPEWDAWRAHSKVPSTTLEKFCSVVTGQKFPMRLAAGACFSGTDGSIGREVVLLAYLQSEWGAEAPGVHALAYDATSRTSIHEDTLLKSSTTDHKIQCIQIGRYGVIVAREESGFSPTTQYDTKAWIYDTQATGPNRNVFVPVSLVSTSARGGYGWTIATDGTRLFWLEISGDNETSLTSTATAKDVNIHRFSFGAGPSLNYDGVVKVASANGTTCEPGLSISGGRAHATWKATTTNRPRYGSATTALGGVLGPIDVIASETAQTYVYCAALNVDDVVVFWDRNGTTDGTPISWRWVKLGSSAPDVRTNFHHFRGVVPFCQPFVFNNRVYIGMTGDGAQGYDGAYETGVYRGSNYGHVMLEISALATAEDDTANGNPFILPMPIALWSRDVSLALPGRGQIPIYGGDGRWYFATCREARKSDEFFIEADNRFHGVLTPTPHTTAVWSFDVFRLNFSDPKRWQHAELDNETVIASSLPYTYNGDRAHECGFVFRPSILSISEAGAGSPFEAGDLLLYKVVYEWEDFSGRRWFSDTSYTATYVIITTGVQVTLTVRPPWLTMKPDGANNFSGRVKVKTYRTTMSAPDEFKLLDNTQYMIWDGTGAFDESIITVNDAGADLSGTERLYIFGGEVDNSVAPTCRALVQHRDRLFAIDLEENALCYTKPFSRQRGKEWSRFFKLPLPQLGRALCSVEGSLLVFTDKSILVLEGEGPGPTGVPPDAFSRFAVLSQDHGCAEDCAAWRTPRGVIFRSQQGIWLVTPQLGLEYIGAAVEDLVRTVDYFVDAALDEANGVLRLLAKMQSGPPSYKALCYWYDSDRWSVNTLDDLAFSTIYSSTVHNGSYYMASFNAAVVQQTDGYFMDGLTTNVFSIFAPYQRYEMKVRTPWIKFDSMASFKRLWRVMPKVRLAALGAGSPGRSFQNLEVVLETDGDPLKTQTAIWRADDFASIDAFDDALEFHVKYQKGQRYRITMRESMQLAADGESHPTNGPDGYVFAGIGFELGLKVGAGKLNAERSPK